MSKYSAYRLVWLSACAVMRQNMRSLASSAGFVALLAPAIASAHEVYVLTPAQIAADTSEPAFDMIQVALGDMGNFVFWGFITFLVISTVFCISIFRKFELTLDPLFDRMKRYAPAICRVTVGVGLIAGAYYQATYSPELPYASVFGSLSPLVSALVGLCGLLIITGFYVRPAALIALFFYCVALYFNGAYMLTYTNYLGEFILLIAMGAQNGHHARGSLGQFWRRAERAFAAYEFAVLRVAFGISLLYAALFAKIIHNNLALQVAELPLAGHAFGVAHYLGFEPHFLVLGAALIELIISVFFIFGIEIRWTSLFLLFWLSLSLWWFGESVWPHIILIGIPIAFFFHGYDRFSAEGRFFKKHRLEPVL